MMKILGYIGFAIFSLVIFLYWTFPTDVVGSRIGYEARKRSRGKIDIRFEEFDFYRITGIEAEKVLFQFGEGGGKVVNLEDAHARFNILPLFTLTPSVNAEFIIGDGNVELEGTYKGNTGDLEAFIDDVNLDKIEVLKALIGVPIEAVVGGDIVLATTNGLNKVDGNVILKLKDFSIGPGKIAGMTIPKLPLGSIDVEFKAKNGTIQIESFEQQGGSFSLDLTGSIGLKRRFRSSSLDNVCVKFKPDPNYLKRHPNLATAIELAGMRLKKDSSDYFNISLSGFVGRPRLSPRLCQFQSNNRRSKSRK